MKRRIASITLVLALILAQFPAVSFTAAAADEAGTAETANADTPSSSDENALSALGIDSSKAPSGYDENSTDNPYGRNTIQIAQVPELYTVGLSQGVHYAPDYDTANGTVQNGTVTETHDTGTSDDILKSSLYGHNAWGVDSVSEIMAGVDVSDALVGGNPAKGTTTAKGDYTLITQGVVDTTANPPPSLYSAKGFLAAPVNAAANLGSGFQYALSSVASGNFDGNANGFFAQSVMVYTSDYSKNGGLYLRFGNVVTGEYGANAVTLLDTSVNIGNPDLIYEEKPVENFAQNPYQLQNYLQTVTGDWNGDGIDEVAVYVPEQGNSRIEVYALQLTSADDPDTAYLDASKWSVAWSYYLREGDVVSNMVSLVSGDVNKDGIDDLSGTWGYYYGPTQNAGSTAVVMFGAKGTALFHDSQQFDLKHGTSNIVRASFAYGDISGTGSNALILCGQSDADLQAGNTYTRYVALYNWNGTKFTYTVDQDFDLFLQRDGKAVWPAMSMNRNMSAPVFYSLPLCAANTAMISQGMATKSQLLYFDSLIIEYTQDGLSIKEAWDVQKVTQSDTANCQNYVEFGAVSGDFTGQRGYGALVTMIQTLCSVTQRSTGYTVNGNHQEPTYEWRYYYKNWLYKIFHIKTWYYAFTGWVTVNDSRQVNVGYGQFAMGENCMVVVDATSGSGYLSRAAVDFSQSICLANTDNDSTFMNYSGEHYFTYTNPKVLSVLSSPPFFSDLINRDDLSGAYHQSATSYSSTEGSGSGSTVSATITLGAYVSYEHEFKILGVTIAKVEAEATITAGFTYETETTSTLEQTVTYSASAGEDMVAFYSIPMEIYRYTSYVPDGQGGYSRVLTTVNIPHEASVVLLALDKYEEIAKDYSTLPKIADNVLTHSIGVPSTYPSSTNGYNVIAQYNGDPSAVGFTSSNNGASITQEIAMSSETNQAFIGSASLETKAGAGPGDLTVGVVAGVEAGGGKVTISTSGSSFSGEMQNMPVEAQPYGYGMDWKIFCYKYSDGTSSFPVVDYIVSQVGSPAPLPGDFAQDVSRTTADKITLTWSCQKLVSGFRLFRYYDFPEGSGSYQLELVPFSAAERYDEDTKTYYFSYTDAGLSPYTDYRYQIQTVQPSDPKYSIYSQPMVCRTKTGVGYPDITIDGLNASGRLPIYPDASSSVTAVVADPVSYKSLSYQWQKLVKSTWINISGRTDMKLTISNAGLADAALYRCRVNAIYYDTGAAQNYYISAYSDGFASVYDKRTATYNSNAFIAQEEVTLDTDGTAHDGLTASIELYSASKDHSTAPAGSVTFDIKGTDYACSQTVILDVSKDTKLLGPYNQSKYYSNASVTIRDLPAGVYTVTAYYGGNRVFKDMNTSSGILVVIGNSTGYALCMSSESDAESNAVTKFTYGDGIVTTLSEISKAPDKTVQSTVITNGVTYDIVDAAGHVTAFASGGTTPSVGSYTMRAYLDGNLVCAQGFTVAPKPVTVYIPDYKDISAGKPVVDTPPVVMCEEIVKSELDALQLKYTVLNSAGNTTALTAETLPGKYTVTACSSSLTPTALYNNYSITYVSGTYTIIGVTYTFTAEAMEYTDSAGTRAVGTVTILGKDTLTAYYTSGTAVLLYATPNDGYEVDQWTATFENHSTLSQMGDRLFPIATQAQPVVVTVTFKPAQMTLSVKTQPAEGGTVTCTSDPNYTSGAYVSFGAQYTFVAAPSPGYHFSSWRRDTAGTSEALPGTPEADGTNTLTVTTGATSATLFALFTRDSYTLRLTGDITAYHMFDDDGNSTTPEIRRYLTDGVSVVGDTQITVMPKLGYQAAQGATFVVNNVVTADADAHVFSITENTTVSLNTVQNSYAVTVVSENGTVDATVNGKAADAAGLAEVGGGSALTFTPYAVRGYVFDHWTVENRDNQTSDDFTGDSLKGHMLSIPALGANITVKAVFAPNTAYTASAAVSDAARGVMQYTLYDIYGRMVGTADTVMPPEGIAVYNGESVVLKVSVRKGSMVEQWKVNGVYKYIHQNTYTLPVINGDIDATVYLKASSNYYVYFTQMGTTGSTLSATADEISIKSGKLQSGGSRLIFTAAPADGFMTDYWTVTAGEPSATESDDRIKAESGNVLIEPVFTIESLNQTITVRVHFTALATNEVTLPATHEMGASHITYATPIKPTDSGELDPDVTSAQVRLNGTVKLEFTPNEGYRTGADRITAALKAALGTESTALVSVQKREGTYCATVTNLTSPLCLTDESAIYQQVYTITVPEHVNASAMTAAEGDLVRLTVTPASGYALSALTLDNGVLNEAVSPSTLVYTFTMPAVNVTVNATFAASYIGGGGGGFSGQTLEILAIGNGNRKYLKVNMKDNLAQLIAGINELKPVVSESGALTLDLTELADVRGIIIPSDIFGFISQANGLCIKLPDASVAFDRAALSAVCAAGTGEITLAAADVDAKTLPGRQQTLIGDHPVVKLTLAVGNTKVQRLDSGTAQVSIPCVLGTDEKPEAVTIWCLGGSFIDAVKGSYDAAAKAVVFTTERFSDFAVGILPFTDVIRGEWYFENVSFAYANGLMKGNSDTVFAPAGTMTRAMLVTVLWRLAGQPAAQNTPAFTDVPSGKWYSEAVAWANENGIVSGYGNGIFGTDDAVTREQMAVILMNYYQHQGGDVSSEASLESFTDKGKVSGWAQNAMRWAHGKGLINGVGGGMLDPRGSATRSQVAAILERFIKNIVLK